MVRSRRDDFEICMEILDYLLDTNLSKSITEIISHCRIKHSKAKKLIESMINTEWMTEERSLEDDLRYKSFFKILEEGEKVINIYKQNIAKLFDFLSED